MDLLAFTMNNKFHVDKKNKIFSIIFFRSRESVLVSQKKIFFSYFFFMILTLFCSHYPED